ncbi:MAG: hypothetical protein ACLGI6_23330, partial [Gammaproteobacteria bacterium]
MAGFSPADLDLDAIAAARLLHSGSIGLIDRSARDASLLAVETARRHGRLVSFDANLRLALWPDRDTAERLIRQGIAAAPVHDVVAGVADLPGPEDVTTLADAVLDGVYTRDLDVALERAAAAVLMEQAAGGVALLRRDLDAAEALVAQQGQAAGEGVERAEAQLAALGPSGAVGRRKERCGAADQAADEHEPADPLQRRDRRARARGGQIDRRRPVQQALLDAGPHARLGLEVGRRLAFGRRELGQ